MNLSQVLHTALMIGVLSFIASYTTIASVAKHRGSYARPITYHHRCWRNRWGQIRCSR